MTQPLPPPAQPVLMTEDQFQALGTLYERTQVETRKLTRLTQAAHSVDRCDGLVPENTRVWVRCMDGWATEQDADDSFMISLAKHTTSGDLLEEIRRWCNTEVSVTTWAQLKVKVLEHFLSACENLKLQALLEQSTQRNGETTSAYIRRFKAEAQRAYVGARAPSEEQRVVASFLRGFVDRHFAERVFRKGKTTTLAEVTEAAAALEAEQEKLNQVFKTTGAEPMEVDVVQAEAAADTLTSLQKKIEQLSVRVEKAEAQNKQRHQTRPKSEAKAAAWRMDKRAVDKVPVSKHKGGPRLVHKWTEDGRPICNYCSQPGHFFRECPNRRGRSPRTAAPRMQPKQKKQTG